MADVLTMTGWTAADALYQGTVPAWEETPIEAMDSAVAITDALARHARMIQPGTVDPVSAAVAIGSGAFGEQWRADIGDSGNAARVMSLTALQPLATATAPGATSGLAWEVARRLAGFALEPLSAPTSAAVTHGRSLTPSGMALIGRGRQVSVHAAPHTRAYSAFVELTDWLGMTQEEAARLLGYGRTTPLSWRRGHEPRPARARRLYQTHALVGTLVRRLGREATQSWLERGAPSPLELIAAGDVSRADDRAEALIFETAPARPPIDAWVEEPPGGLAADAVATPSRVVRRRGPTRRGR